MNKSYGLGLERHEGRATTSSAYPGGSFGSTSGLGSLRSSSARRPVGSVLAPPTFGSTRDPQSSGSSGFHRPTGSPLVSRLTTSATDFRAIHCAPSLHPFSCRRFLLAVSIASVFIASVLAHTIAAPALGYSGSTYDARRRDIAWVSCTSDVAQLPQPSVCICGSTGSVSVGRPPVSVSLVTIWTPPSLDYAMVCRHWGALGLCLQTISTVTARGSSSCHHLPFSSSLPASNLLPHLFVLTARGRAYSEWALCHSLFSLVTCFPLFSFPTTPLLPWSPSL
ncbi:hypothetical protein PO909_004577 [Leuciscus waleckii]